MAVTIAPTVFSEAVIVNCGLVYLSDISACMMKELILTR